MLLRPLTASDRDEFVRVQEVSRELHAPWTPARTPGETSAELFEHQLLASLLGARDGTRHRLVGVLDDGRIAGFFALFDIVRGAFHNAMASWSVNAEVQRQGYATEGVIGLLDLAFSAPPVGLGLHRVQANVMPTNAASLRVAEKAGFRREGHARGYLRIAGAWEDHLLLAKLAEEHRVTGTVPSSDR